MRNRKSTNNAPRWKIVSITLLLINAIGAIFFIFNPKRIRQYVSGQKRELGELSNGTQDVGRFFNDSTNLLRDFFIPHQGNDHRPKMLRPKSLMTVAMIAVLAKVLLTGFLFLNYPTPASLSAIVAERMIELANAARAEAGVAPLAPSSALTQTAASKGQDMISRNYFAHDTPDGKRPWEWIDRGQYDYVYAGENLAMDFVSAEVVQDAFMKSPTHRKNILNPKYQDIGIAVLHGKINDRETILLVEYFGTQRNAINTVAVASNTEVTAVPTVNETPPTQEPVSAEPEPEPIAEPSVPDNATVAGEATAPAAVPATEAEIEQALAAEPQNRSTIVVDHDQQRSKNATDLVIEYSNVFFIAFLLFILISLLLNVIIKIKIQHPTVILQTVAVIALLAALSLVKFHFAESVAPELLIL